MQFTLSSNFYPPIIILEENEGNYREWREYDDSLIVPYFDVEPTLNKFGIYGYQDVNRAVPHWTTATNQNHRYPPAFTFQQRDPTGLKGTSHTKALLAR